MKYLVAAAALALAPMGATASPWVDEALRDEPAEVTTPVEEVERPAPGIRAEITTAPEAPVVDLDAERVAKQQEQSRFRRSTIHQRAAEVAHWAAHSGSHRHVLTVEEEAFVHEHEVEVIDLGHPVPVKKGHHMAVKFHSGPYVASEMPDHSAIRGTPVREIPMRFSEQEGVKD